MASTFVAGTYDVERGPDWLFVRPTLPVETGVETFADQVWSMIDTHMVHRCVLELDRVERVNSPLVAQLLKLRNKMRDQGGTLRLCGLNEHGREVLRTCRLGDQLHSFPSRADAVLGPRPTLPR